MASFAASYVVLTAIANAALIPIGAAVHGTQRLLGASEIQLEAKLTNKGILPFCMAGTKGSLLYGDFLLPDGTTGRFYDGCDVISGDLFPNGDIPFMRTGETYNLTLFGSDSMSYAITDFERVSP